MTQIVCQNAVSDPALAFGSLTLPSYLDMLGEWWLGSAASGMTNRVTGVNATLIGAPDISPGFMTAFNDGAGGKGFLADVGAPGAGAVSLVALVRPLAIVASIHKFAGSSADNGTNYNLVIPDLTHVSFGNGQTTGATDQSIEAIADNTKFQMVMGVGLLNTPSRIYMTTGGAVPVTVFDDGVAAYEPTTRDTSALQVGGLFNAGWQGSTEIAAIALVAGGQDAAFLESLYARWKPYAEELGLVVA